MLPAVLLRRLLRRADAREVPDRLRPATEVIERFGRDGADGPAAIAWTRRQVAGLVREVADDTRWERLRDLVLRAGDPWNADDWPLGFDPLVCCVPLCTLVRYECVRCPVGRHQDGRSCAHPQSAFGRIGVLVTEGRRERLLAYLGELDTALAAMQTHDAVTETP